MNILFLTHRLPYAPNRGDRIRAYYLLREMSKFAEVSLFSLVHDDAEEREAGSVPFARDVSVARVLRWRNLAAGAIRLPTTRPLTHSLLDAPGARAALARKVAAHHFDLVLAYCSGMARFALEPPLQTLPFVLDMVDVDSAKWAGMARDTRGLRRWIYRREAATLGRFEALASRRARCTLVVNARERDALRALAPDARVEIVPNGIDLDAFRPSTPPAADPVVAFAGVMSYAPNHEGVAWFVREVWPRIRAARPEARFIVIGSEPSAEARAWAAADPSIEVTGAVSAVQPHLWRAAVSVAPLHLARGLQNKVLEALAAGLPVVATPAVGEGLPAMASRGCFVADRADEFADRVLHVLAMPPDARRRLAGEALPHDMSWANQLGPLRDLLRRAVTEKSQQK
jgi:sugar transferase (PEP-CTERM/EpsH1 system associated)